MPYTPTEWGNKNPKLTPELMNHLENGIVELESSTNASVSELENSIAELESSTNASVSELENGIAALDDYIKEGRMSNFTTLMTLGAVNDGITDNTEVVKKAVQYCKEKNKDLYIEQGTYLIKDRIIIDFPLRIQGSNIDNTKLLFELPEPSTETKYDDTYWEESNSAFIIKSDNAAISNLTIQNKNLEDRRWNGIIFHYPKTKDDGSKFYASSERCELSSLDIRNFKSGIFIYGGWSRNISMSKILDCTYGIKYEALENINWSTSGDMISNCYIVGSKEYGLYANKTFETSVEGVIFEYNKVPIYCANALDTIFTNCWNEANINRIEIDGNAKFVNGYNITNETIHQTENGIVFIEKPNDVMALRANEVVFHQVDGIIVKGVSLGSKTINLIKNSSFGTIADKNFNSWTVDAQSITTISNTETYKNNNSVFFDFHEGWASDPFYGITTDAISIPKGDYKFSFAFKSPDRSTIDNKAKYLIMKLNSEGTVVDYLANEDFLPNGNNVWEIVSKAISITDETASIKIKIQVNRNGLLYISTPVFADADISSDSLSLKDSGVEGIITVVNQNGTEVNQIYTASKTTSDVAEAVTKINSNLTKLEYGEVAGGKNLFDKNSSENVDGWLINGIPNGETTYNKKTSHFIRIDENTFVYNKGNVNNKIAFYDSNKTFISEKNQVIDVNVVTMPANAKYVRFVYFDVEKDLVQIEKGTTATDYEPYIPSVKMLAEENAQQNTEIMDIKMLGWSVPKECPIQNEVSGNQFIKEVGRIDLSTLSFSELGNFGYYVEIPTSKAPINNSTVANIYLEGFTTVKRIDLDSSPNSIAMTGSKEFCINNGKIAIPSGYLYYELETPITMTIDGNEVTERLNESLEQQGLLNKFDGVLFQGSYDRSTGNLGPSEYYVTNTNAIACKPGDKITIKNTFADAIDIVYFSNGNYLSGDSVNSKEHTFTVPQNSTSIHFNIYANAKPTPQKVGVVSVYINNEIDELKNDLDKQKEIYSETTINIGRKAGTNVGDNSTAEGHETTASGKESHAEGRFATASGECSHAEGNSTSATQSASHAEGCATTASGDYSHAEGYGPTASGYCSHAEGNVTTASGDYSHAEGRETTASVDCSHAEGRGTIASGWNQHVQGKYNEADTSGEYAHIIGGGADDTNRKNIHTVDWEGNAEYAGNVTSTDSSGNKTSLNDLITRLEFTKPNVAGKLDHGWVDIINVSDKSAILRGSVTGTVGTFFNVSKKEVIHFDISIDDTVKTPDWDCKLLYSTQGDFETQIVGLVKIARNVASAGTKRLAIDFTFNNNYNFTSEAVFSGIVDFNF